MFNIDDNLLAAIGYNVATLSEEKKNQYRREISEELNQRASAEVLARLSKQEALEFEDVNSNPDRTRRWLAEFHGDYASRQDYQAIRELFETDEDAMSFYASALWMRYAVRRLRILGATGIRGKVARFIVEQQETESKENQSLPAIRGKGNRALMMNREQMADYLSVTRPSLSREISAMAQEGIIAVDGSLLRVLDQERLEEYI